MEDNLVNLIDNIECKYFKLALDDDKNYLI